MNGMLTPWAVMHIGGHNYMRLRMTEEMAAQS